MEQHNPLPFLILFFFFSFFPPLFQSQDLRPFIIQLHPKSQTTSNHHQWHLSFLPSSSRLLYSYHTTLIGFAALLSPDEADALRNSPSVIAVHPDRYLKLHTTYSYKFLNLAGTAGSPGLWTGSKFGRGAIIGVLDTGVWPESPSFSDHHMPPIPSRWKGSCQIGENFNSTNCNRKLIGARFYSKGHRANSPAAGTAAFEYISPRDAHGHGTHTSSTAGGASVSGASVLGAGAGTATGMAPGAHIAVYKVCWYNGCYSSDILAGMDDAVHDGVDVLSLSLGGFPMPLFEDSIAIGSFRAVERGVAVVCAGGNNGPAASSVANEAPWITTVGASTMDRRFPAAVRLANGRLLYGESITGFSNNGGKVPELELVYENGGNRGAEFCFRGSLSKSKVKGKIVICDRGVNGRAEKGQAVKEAGGAAMILANAEINQEEDSLDAHVLPSTLIGFNQSIQLKSFINSTKIPKARIIFAATATTGRSRAPSIAPFSSRGPSLTIPSVLKPDIIAPGVNIIAAWPENLGPSGLADDHRRSNFSILSGTSMACPHVSGIVALVRAAHPSWSPAAVRSAIMTTADVLDRYAKPIMDGVEPANIFAMGAGHINPSRAMDPGLVYDIESEDYVIHLCSLGYTKSEMFAITHRIVDCGDIKEKNKWFSLNYPSISVEFKRGTNVIMTRRTASNVGKINSTYFVKVSPPKGVRVRVVPKRLNFGAINDKRSYLVWFMSRRKDKTEGYSEGEIIWVGEEEEGNRVRSPVSVEWKP
ncbi:LOW QUALITY PROTEIN: subtilisin-like protease SBT1.2 [Phalaenopsis equestris]|uniref:LOW QUALITY PROTEIN: subtilisin-like protease SBT1.2 n=1 Tax=Phalaenopsis equestris TaxID=78828 RepID=UPI0009E60AF3|nr:LOW QUALITY PROTEIN: subtilisin-like protease SBT1.2 [Phalaenopsis equestris]